MENKSGNDKSSKLFRRLLNWNKNRDHNPLKDAKEVAVEFEDDLRHRLDVVVSENDAQHVNYQVNARYVVEDRSSILSVRVFMKPDKMQYPQGVALQIHNAIWETESDKDHRGFSIKKLRDTIGTYRVSLGKIKLTDDKGNLTTQKTYTFK